jgi:DNA-binding MarR family transcriptional regulator
MKAGVVAIRDFRKNLRALEREVQLSMASDTGCCGVSLAQCHLLLEVEDRGRTSITALADILELDKSTLSRTVDGMCRAGLLNREIDPSNRRQQIISLTEAGKEKAETINSLCDGSYARLFDFIPAASRRSVVKSVALVAEAMRHMRKSPGTPCCKES